MEMKRRTSFIGMGEKGKEGAAKNTDAEKFGNGLAVTSSASRRPEPHRQPMGKHKLKLVTPKPTEGKKRTTGRRA